MYLRRSNKPLTFVGVCLLFFGFVSLASAQVRPSPPNPIAVEGGSLVSPPPSGVVFYDNFDYDVSRSGTAARAPFLGHGWSYVKAVNAGDDGACGYLFTQPDTSLNSRVLVMEARPQGCVPPGWSYGQTSHYLLLGREGGPTFIPPNAWFQFWTYATTDSSFAARDKVLYPCRTYYPCQEGQFSWLFAWGSRGYETDAGRPSDRFLAMQGETADFRAADEYPTNAGKLFQNVSRTPIAAGRWIQLRLHIDISGAQGVYEAWIRERGQTVWTKLADWRGGVTPNFSWPLPTSQRTGFPMMATPTTVNGPGDSIVYIDDFTLAGSSAALPQ